MCLLSISASLVPPNVHMHKYLEVRTQFRLTCIYKLDIEDVSPCWEVCMQQVTECIDLYLLSKWTTVSKRQQTTHILTVSVW